MNSGLLIYLDLFVTSVHNTVSGAQQVLNEHLLEKYMNEASYIPKYRIDYIHINQYMCSDSESLLSYFI